MPAMPAVGRELSRAPTPRSRTRDRRRRVSPTRKARAAPTKALAPWRRRRTTRRGRGRPVRPRANTDLAHELPDEARVAARLGVKCGGVRIGGSGKRGEALDVADAQRPEAEEMVRG